MRLRWRQGLRALEESRCVRSVGSHDSRRVLVGGQRQLTGGIFVQSRRRQQLLILRREEEPSRRYSLLRSAGEQASWVGEGLARLFVQGTKSMLREAAGPSLRSSY